MVGRRGEVNPDGGEEESMSGVVGGGGGGVAAIESAETVDVWSSPPDSCRVSLSPPTETKVTPSELEAAALPVFLSRGKEPLCKIELANSDSPFFFSSNTFALRMLDLNSGGMGLEAVVALLRGNEFWESEVLFRAGPGTLMLAAFTSL